MRQKSYEKKGALFFFLGSLLLVEIVVVFFLIIQKEYTYQKVSGIILKENLCVVYVDKRTRKTFYKNKKIVVENKLVSYEVEEDKGIILTNENTKYYELWLKVKLPKKKKVNDSVEISIKESKKRIIKIMKQIWEGG